MRRRVVIALGTAVLAPPLVSLAQQQPDTRARIGFLPLGSQSNSYDRSLVDAFRQGLREVGLIENRDITVDVVWVGNESEYTKAVSELVQRGVKVLIPAGTSASVAAKRGSSTIPIVFTTVGDPVGIGLVKDLARPGGNATGFSDVLWTER
jgi:putative ABC transport system substrate-binding protein